MTPTEIQKASLRNGLYINVHGEILLLGDGTVTIGDTILELNNIPIISYIKLIVMLNDAEYMGNL